MLTMLPDTSGGARGARDARKADFRRQPHRSYLFAARPVVVRGAREMEAVGAPRRGDGGRSPLVRRGPGQGDVERYRPWVSPVSERDVRPYRRDEGPRLRMELPAWGETAADDAGAASRRSRPRQSCRRDRLWLPDDQ